MPSTNWSPAIKGPRPITLWTMFDCLAVLVAVVPHLSSSNPVDGSTQSCILKGITGQVTGKCRDSVSLFSYWLAA